MAQDRYYVEVQLAIATYKEDALDTSATTGMRRCIMDVEMFMRNWATVPVDRARYYRYTTHPPLLREVKGWIPKEYALLNVRYGLTVSQTAAVRASRCVAKADKYKVFQVA